MKYIKLFENLDSLIPYEEDWEEFEDDYIVDGDWILFLPNPNKTLNNNFAVKKVLTSKEKYLITDEDIKISEYDKEKFVTAKEFQYIRKLYPKESWELKIGDYFFIEENSGNWHHICVVHNIKMGGVIYNIQPLNYNAGKYMEITNLLNHGEVLIPDDETLEIIKTKIDRVNKKTGYPGPR